MICGFYKKDIDLPGIRDIECVGWAVVLVCAMVVCACKSGP